MEPATIVHFDPARGFGIAEPDYGRAKIFVHRRAMGGREEFSKGDRVVLEIGEREQGLYAISADLLDG